MTWIRFGRSAGDDSSARGCAVGVIVIDDEDAVMHIRDGPLHTRDV
jgi:hypothetical protein